MTYFALSAKKKEKRKQEKHYFCVGDNISVCICPCTRWGVTVGERDDSGSKYRHCCCFVLCLCHTRCRLHHPCQIMCVCIPNIRHGDGEFYFLSVTRVCVRAWVQYEDLWGIMLLFLGIEASLASLKAKKREATIARDCYRKRIAQFGH